MTRSSSALDGVRLKIDRASEHRETFERELLTFFEHEPERVIAKFDEKAGGHDIDVLVPLPDVWSCMIGDFLQNLRNAFDHFVWAAALRRKPKPNTKISFPITKDEKAWDRYLTTAAAHVTRKTVSAPIWRCIAEMQPHARQHLRPDPNPDSDPLWALNEFAKIDRHRTLHVTVASQQGTQIGFGPLPRRGNVIAWDTAPFALDPNERWPRFTTPPIEGDPGVGDWTFSGPAGESQVRAHGQVAFEIVFDPDGPYGGGGWVSEMLTSVYESVDRYFWPWMQAAFNA